MNTDDRADKLMEAMSGGLEELSGAEYELTKDMLRSYCWFAVQISDLTAMVDDQGPLIAVEKGGANNKHTVMVENPAIGVIHKMSSRKAEYYTKLLRVLPDESVEEDAFAKFCGM